MQKALQFLALNEILQMNTKVEFQASKDNPRQHLLSQRRDKLEEGTD